MYIYISYIQYVYIYNYIIYIFVLTMVYKPTYNWEAQPFSGTSVFFSLRSSGNFAPHHPLEDWRCQPYVFGLFFRPM